METEVAVDTAGVVPSVVAGTEGPVGVETELTLAEDGMIGTGVVAIDSTAVLETGAGGTPGVIVAM